MKRNIGYYIFIVIEFFLISCLIYQLAIKGTYMYYKGVTAFILLELLEIFMFYKLNKNINNFKLNFYFLSFRQLLIVLVKIAEYALFLSLFNIFLRNFIFLLGLYRT